MMLAGLGDARVAQLCAMAPRSYWNRYAPDCETWATGLVKWRTDEAADKPCPEMARACAGGAVPVAIGCDQVCPEDVGASAGLSLMGVSIPPVALVAAVAAFFLLGARQ